jgi:hypothetical protein
MKRILRVCEEGRCLRHGAASALLAALIFDLFPADGSGRRRCTFLTYSPHLSVHRQGGRTRVRWGNGVYSFFRWTRGASEYSIQEPTLSREASALVSCQLDR